jgi:hypothetical protein
MPAAWIVNTSSDGLITIKFNQKMSFDEDFAKKLNVYNSKDVKGRVQFKITY